MHKISLTISGELTFITLVEMVFASGVVYIWKTQQEALDIGHM